ncbi:MAG: hypothetical protein IT164_15285 [Bryobacterales bacterium]|nr:hypothetical protein [Bryobacterales bacterium]
MCQDPESPSLPLPQLSDEAAVEILEFIYEILHTFESHYCFQIRRYYEDRSRENLIQPKLDFPKPNPPF